MLESVESSELMRWRQDAGRARVRVEDALDALGEAVGAGDAAEQLAHGERVGGERGGELRGVEGELAGDGVGVDRQDAAPVEMPSSAISSSAVALPATGSETAWRSWRRIAVQPGVAEERAGFAWVGGRGAHDRLLGDLRADRGRRPCCRRR